MFQQKPLIKLKVSTMYQPKREFYTKQREGFELSKDAKNFGLFMEQGTGKTKVTLDTVSYLYNQGKIDTLIVLAWPNGVHRNWVDNELHQDLNCPYLAAFWKSTLDKKLKKQIEKVYCFENGLRVMTYNIEAMNTKSALKNIQCFLDSGRVFFVIDQSACIKTSTAQRTKSVIKLSTHKNILYKRILDGDPIAEGSHEIFMPFKFLDPKIIGLTSYTAFKSTYCELGYFKNIIAYKNTDQLMAKIQPYFFRCTADECLDLPDRIYKRWNFDLSKEERRLYDEMSVLGLATFNTGTEEIISREKLAMIKNMRMQQITSGWFNVKTPVFDESIGGHYLKSTLHPIQKHPSRFLAFQELIKIAKGKILIFSRFTADIKLLEKLLGDEAVSYHGGVSEDNKAEAKRLFMTDDKIRFFIGQPKTAGIGHTLTAAHHIVFYSNDHSLRLRKECEKRAHRIGLKHNLIVWDLIAKDTQDNNIVQCLMKKKKICDEILKEPNNFFLRELDDGSKTIRTI